MNFPVVRKQSKCNICFQFGRVKTLKFSALNGKIIHSAGAKHKNCSQFTMLQAEVASLLCCFPDAVVVTAIYLCANPCLASS